MKIVHVLSRGAEGWAGETGHVDAAKIKEHAFAPGEGSAVCVCGVPLMYDSLCGPRGEELKEGTVLHELGYPSDMVTKF